MGDLFSGIFGGGKGGSSAPPPMPTMPQVDYSGLEGMMMNFENMMMGAMGSMVQAQQAAQMQQAEMMSAMNNNMDIQMPEVYRDPEIDFSEAQNQLYSKTRADYHLDQLRRKGRMDTVLTSPLLDDEDPALGGSVLSGE